MGNNVNSKMIGNVGEAKVLAKLVELQIPVYVQFGDNEPADYLILVDNRPYKVQVKTSTTFNGAIVTDAWRDYRACSNHAAPTILLTGNWWNGRHG